MRPVRVVVGPLAAASANAIALSQTPTTGALTLNGALVTGGVAVLDTQRRVLITTTADETSRTFLLTGTDVNGSVISETITGVNNTTVASVLDYKTVRAITISGNAAGALTVGTNGVGGSFWVRFDDWAPSAISIQCTTSGTVNYTVQQTLDDTNSPNYALASSAVTWVNHPDGNLVAATGTVQGNYAYMPTFARIVINSGTGTVTGTFIQSANVQE